MKEQLDQLNKAKSILASVLGVANHSMKQTPNVQEARNHINQAIQKLQSEQKTQLRRSKKAEHTPYDHWKDVLAGVPSEPVTPFTRQAPPMSLDHLNSMIEEEKSRLAELEAKSQNKDQDDNLITD